MNRIRAFVAAVAMAVSLAVGSVVPPAQARPAVRFDVQVQFDYYLDHGAAQVEAELRAALPAAELTPRGSGFWTVSAPAPSRVIAEGLPFVVRVRDEGTVTPTDVPATGGDGSVYVRVDRPRWETLGWQRVEDELEAILLASLDRPVDLKTIGWEMYRIDPEPTLRWLDVRNALRAVPWVESFEPGLMLRAPIADTDGIDEHFEPVPVRLVDTRTGLGGHAGAVAARVEFGVQVTGAHEVAGDASAVAVNVTAVGASVAGYVTVYPCGDEPQPPTSNLNYVPDRIVANATIVRVGAGGRICVKTLTDVDVVIDLQGWYTARTDLRATKPARLADTRIGLGIGHALTAGTVARLRVAGTFGMPADVGTVVVNVSAVDGTSPGFVTAYPCGGPVPLASNVNVWPGNPIANLAFVGVGTGGDICVYSNVDTELVVDLQGWFYDVASYHPLTPYRAYDSRDHGPPVAAGSELVVPVRYNQVPDRADVVAVNVTAVDAAGPAYVTVYPCGEPVPLVSNNNTSPDRTVATTVLARVGRNGSICLTSNLATHLVVDIDGWQDATRTIGP